MILIIVVAFIASLLTVFSGFGLGTLLMPAVAIFFPVTVAVALTACVHLLHNLCKLLLFWRDVHWPVSLQFGIPAVLAAIPGAWLLTHLGSLPSIIAYQFIGIDAVVTPVKLAVGVLLIIFAVAEWRGLAKKYSIPTRYLAWGGILSGFFGGLSGHQGAFRAAFLLHAGIRPEQFVATNAVIASLVDISRLVVYGLNFTLLIAQVNNGLLIGTIIAAFAGILVGKRGIKKVTIALLQQFIAIILLLLGALLCAGVV